MGKEEFIEKLKELLDCEGELSMETDLSDIEEWDSLGILSFLAELGERAPKPIQAKDVKAAKTVSDLFDLIQ